MIIKREPIKVKMRFFVLLMFLSGQIFAQSIIPKPDYVQKTGTSFVVNENTTVFTDKNVEGLESVVGELKRVLSVSTRLKLNHSSVQNTNQISFLQDLTLPVEGYTLQVKEDGVEIKAATAVGFFYGVQSLLQLFPTDIFSQEFKSDLVLKLDGVLIKDQPRFGYRGVMLDVSRHFFPAEYIKKMIDIFAMYKINTLHWHLTDDQGWRIEIKKYPKLTEVGSIRKETAVGHFSENKFDGKPYGGFYTQDQIKDVVAYAQKKHITIIPEIEMPGHAKAALAAYPELGCTGGPYEVRTTWDIEENIYCPTETTFKFLEDVLVEVMELFPGKYIHIGGDEAPKTTWKNSEYAQELMKREGLKDEHELQSYFIKRIDKFVTSKGRRIIGWDEILEGGLSPNATVMSWRGEEGGIEAAKMKHDVVMTPNSHVYLDYYQGEPTHEPLAIGGYLPLEKVYSYEPISDKLTKDEVKYILGVQANLWAEYIKTPTHSEYMLFPRVLAVAEIGWSNKKKDYENFVKRVVEQRKVLNLLSVNSSNSFLNVTFTTDKNRKNETTVGLSSVGKGEIRYTTNNTDVNSQSRLFKDNSWIAVTEKVTIKAGLFSEEGKLLSKITSKSFDVSKSTGYKYKLSAGPDKQREMDKFILTDGQRGDANGQELWAGFNGKDLNVTIDLEKVTSVSVVEMAFLGDYTSWIQTPSQVQVSVSTDGKIFKNVGTRKLGKMVNLSAHTVPLAFDFKKTKARYIRVEAKNQGLLPDGHPSAGNPSWVFIDEVSVN